jgi:DNA-binding NtrC family response regulator
MTVRTGEIKSPSVGQSAPAPAAKTHAPSLSSRPAVSSFASDEEFPSLASIEQQHIEAALAFFSGNRTRASAALGISKATLWRKLKAYEQERQLLAEPEA